jgi:hypothetical protein
VKEGEKSIKNKKDKLKGLKTEEDEEYMKSPGASRLLKGEMLKKILKK